MSLGPTTLGPVTLAVVCGGGGVLLLYAAWRRRAGRWRVGAGWLCLVADAPGWRLAGMAWDMAVAAAVLTASLAALALLARRAEFGPAPTKAGKARAGPTEPPPAPGPHWRGVARALLVGPIAAAAALGLATALALHGPFGEADRLVAAGFLFPLAWAAAAVWATTDGRLLRVGAGLAAVATVAFSWAAA